MDGHAQGVAGGCGTQGGLELVARKVIEGSELASELCHLHTCRPLSPPQARQVRLQGLHQAHTDTILRAHSG